MDLGGRGFGAVKGLGLLLLGLVFLGALLSYWDWTFDGTTLPPAALSGWLLGMALVCGGYGAQSLVRAVKG